MAPGGERTRDLDALTVHPNLATGICAAGTCQYFHQSRLAGAVFAHQRMHLTGVNGEIYAAQCLGPGKRLGDATHLKHDQGLPERRRDVGSYESTSLVPLAQCGLIPD